MGWKPGWMSNLRELGVSGPAAGRFLGALLGSQYRCYLMTISSAVFKSSVGFQCHKIFKLLLYGSVAGIQQ